MPSWPFGNSPVAIHSSEGYAVDESRRISSVDQ